ncbi:hypothetical protein FE374_02660 [Georgenia yuyongxinii]|uniref:Uncharacterized protein n=1 Tax=Georgenia yuyongxinii TaxID=2589797 RepID=A0A5B8C6X9_9MICO|nr:hypothetical protein [Georgenia yuyongxinii]QDC23676.1 hypothetical protein FE374_02660 [Georgenia yuyongxinii]
MTHTAILLVTERRDLLGVGERLVLEFRGEWAAGAVFAEVALCRAALIRAGVRAGLAAATEAMARGRLVRHADAAQELASVLARRERN